jgi:hypothetical protein
MSRMPKPGRAPKMTSQPTTTNPNHKSQSTTTIARRTRSSRTRSIEGTSKLCREVQKAWLEGAAERPRQGGDERPNDQTVPPARGNADPCQGTCQEGRLVHLALTVRLLHLCLTSSAGQKGEPKPKQHEASSARTKPQTSHSARPLKSKLSRGCQNKAEKVDMSKTYPRRARSFSRRVSGAHPADGDVVTNDVGRGGDEMEPAISGTKKRGGHTPVLGLHAHVLTTCANCIYCLNHVLIRRMDLAWRPALPSLPLCTCHLKATNFYCSTAKYWQTSSFLQGLPPTTIMHLWGLEVPCQYKQMPNKSGTTVVVQAGIWSSCSSSLRPCAMRCRLGKDKSLLLEAAHLPWPGLARVKVSELGSMTYSRVCGKGRICDKSELCLE